jgi:DNA polymerase-3 subunit delta'
MLDRFSGFTSIRGQNQPIWFLTTLLRKGTIPHALLFTGIEGIGKRMTAMAFAMACLCRGDRLDENRPSLQSFPQKSYHRPCLDCNTCRRVSSGIHPDVIRIDPEGAYIRIKQIRSLCTTLSLKPYEDGLRIVIISNAHKMNAEASNALLKILEEPPDKTIIVLTASATSKLLPTIASRCQCIGFNPLSPVDIKRELIEKNELDPNSAKIVAVLANGSMSKAYEMIKTNYLSYRIWLLKAAGMLQPVGEETPVWQGLAIAERLSKQKERLNDCLEIIKSWLRDVLIYPYSPDKIINRDMIKDIEEFSKTESTESLLKKLSVVENTQKVIEANGNLRLTLDVMVLQLTQSDD